MRLNKHAVAGAVALLLLLPLAAHGGGVVTECTESNLRAAMAGGGTVTFACDGTITLSNTITTLLNTVLDGSGHQITISGNNLVRVFHVNTNVSFTAMNLTIASGRSTNGAGIFNDGGTVTLFATTFARNVATNARPAFAGNGRGGGIFNHYGTLNATDCAFVENKAQHGNLDWVAGGGPIPSHGGAIYNLNGSAHLQSCVFIANTAQDRGEQGDYEAYEAAGGAIYNAGNLTASQCGFLQNSAIGGNGQYFYNGVPYTIHTGGNGGSANGGALCNVAVMAIDRSLFASNSATGGAGGKGSDAWAGLGWPYANPGGNGGNGGNGNGAAIFNGGSANLVNCTLAWNRGMGGEGGPASAGASFWWEGHLYSAPGGGPGSLGSGFGGIHSSNAVLNLTNCTLAFNAGQPGWSPESAASGIYAGAPAFTNTSSRLVNTLLAFNSLTNCSGKITDVGHNLSSDASCAFTNTGSLNNTDPKLGPLANNGGPTLTMALQPGSPAIDGGDTAAAPPTDQRGFPRPVGIAVDIGAFELGPAYLSLIRSPGTGLDLIASGVSGQSFCLWTSSNLTAWLPVSTNQFDPTGMCIFHDNALPSPQPVFYRLTLP
jgi:hypothetical protein